MLKLGLVILSPDKDHFVFIKRLDKGKSHYDLCREFIEEQNLFDGTLEYLDCFYNQAIYLIGSGYVLLQVTPSNYFDVLYLPRKLQIHQYKWLRLRGILLKRLNLALVSLNEKNCIENYDKENLEDISVYLKFVELISDKKLETVYTKKKKIR